MKMGRPKKKSSERKQTFSLRFTPKELAAFKKAAKRKKLALRDWIALTLVKAS